MVILDHIVHTYACQHSLSLACNNTFLMDEGLLSISQACCGQLEKILITIEPMRYLDQILHTYLFSSRGLMSKHSTWVVHITVSWFNGIERERFFSVAVSFIFSVK